MSGYEVGTLLYWSEVYSGEISNCDHKELYGIYLGTVDDGYGTEHKAIWFYRDEAKILHTTGGSLDLWVKWGKMVKKKYGLES